MRSLADTCARACVCASVWLQPRTPVLVVFGGGKSTSSRISSEGCKEVDVGGTEAREALFFPFMLSHLSV